MLNDFFSLKVSEPDTLFAGTHVSSVNHSKLGSYSPNMHNNRDCKLRVIVVLFLLSFVSLETMPAFPAVFISYNPNSEFEQTLAIRLHTIGAVHGFNMLLPDRTYNSQSVSTETKGRIFLADFFILFSTGPMSRVVQEEINVAFSKLHDRSKILVIYDQRVGKNLKADNCTEIFVDTREDPLKIVTEITRKIQAVQSKKSASDSFLSSLAGILLIGLGLFVLNEFFTEEGPQKTAGKKKSTKKSLTSKKRKH